MEVKDQGGQIAVKNMTKKDVIDTARRSEPINDFSNNSFDVTLLRSTI